MTPFTLVRLDVPAEIESLSIMTAGLNELIRAQTGRADAELLSHNARMKFITRCAPPGMTGA